MTLTTEPNRPITRLRHALLAGLIVLVLSFLSVFKPFDQLIWVAQARLASFEASGDIVFVGAEEDLTDPQFPQRREKLARAITRLKEAGARSVYLDMAFEEPSRPQSDRALNEALREFEGEAFLIRSLTTGIEKTDLKLADSTTAVKKGISEVGGERDYSLFNVVWSMPFIIELNEMMLENTATSLAGTRVSSSGKFPISYGFDLASIPKVGLAKILDSGSLPRKLAEGKKILIGQMNDEKKFSVPGQIGVPGSLIHIYAAETLKAGLTRQVPQYALLAAALCLVMLMSAIRQRAIRRAGYAALMVMLGGGLALGTMLAIRANISEPAALVLVFAGFRWRANMKNRTLLVDQDTNLPTTAVLERDAQVAREQPTIIVARIHRFEDVRRSLPAGGHAEYLLRIVERLGASAPDVTIYLGPGHTIAWCSAERRPEVISEHLEGLRALFAAPLLVCGHQIDASLTFGVDTGSSDTISRRLASATAAAERTTETYLPIAIADSRSEDELIREVSLQARIDAALAGDEIFLAYQPKISLQTGRMTGMEALVRWRDADGRIIPPIEFIGQCEESGRIAHLTRHVLREACRAGAATDWQGIEPSIAVNISATLLHDPKLEGMVREALEESRFDPARLTLEVTETFRISDMRLAAANLRRLMDLGPSISMDDFGIGAASYEALLQLPFSELKIDRAFIEPLGRDPRALAIVRSIIDLGRQLRIKVVAEGVEDTATLNLLHRAGCPLAQGYGICRPVPLAEVVRFGNAVPILAQHSTFNLVR